MAAKADEVDHHLIAVAAAVMGKGDLSGSISIHRLRELGAIDTVLSMVYDDGASEQVTLLHAAAANGRTKIANLLLKAGADINWTSSEFGLTPLHCAAAFGCVELIAALVQSSADVGATDGSNRTPLDVAKEKGHHVEVAAELQRHSL